MNSVYTVIQALSPKLKTTPVVIFSSALQLAGIPVEPADVDLELHPSDFERIAPEVTEMRESPCKTLFGLYKKIEINGIHVELTSRTVLRKVNHAGWETTRDINYRRDVDYFRIKNHIIPYYKPLAQLKLYLAMNRPQDIEKIALLRKHIYG